MFVAPSFRQPVAWHSIGFNCFVSATVTDDVVTSLLTRHASVRRLDLSFCKKITDRALQHASYSVGHLYDTFSLIAIHFVVCLYCRHHCTPFPDAREHLSLEGNFKNLNDAGIAALVQASAYSLTSLNLSGCAQLSTTVLNTIATQCRNLVTINLTDLPNMKDNILVTLSMIPTLKEAILDCAKLTPVGLSRFFSLMGPRLEKLSLKYVRTVSDAVLSELARHCPSLRT
jgi:hypothetical protein